MKRSVVGLFSFIMLAVFVLSACNNESRIVEGKVNVFTTFFPLYDFTREIGGEHVNVVNMLPTGVEAHDWSPKSRDLSDLRKADVFVYNGAGFEGWVADFLPTLESEGVPVVVEAVHDLQLIAIEEKSGEQPAAAAQEDEHGHEHEQEHEHGDVDPHVWLSPLQAKFIAQEIYEALLRVDAAHAADYQANFQRYSNRLEQLHQT